MVSRTSDSRLSTGVSLFKGSPASRAARLSLTWRLDRKVRRGSFGAGHAFSNWPWVPSRLVPCRSEHLEELCRCSRMPCSIDGSTSMPFAVILLTSRRGESKLVPVRDRSVGERFHRQHSMKAVSPSQFGTCSLA